MFKDLQQWRAIRRAVLEEGVSKRQACREAGIHWKTLKKVLLHQVPPNYQRRSAPNFTAVTPYQEIMDRIIHADRLRPRGQRHSPEQIAVILRDEHGLDADLKVVRRYAARARDPRELIWEEVTVELCRLLGEGLQGHLLSLLTVDPCQAPLRRLQRLRRALGHRADADPARTTTVHGPEDFVWIHRLLLGKERLCSVRNAVGDSPDLRVLFHAVRHGGLKRRTKALVVLACRRGISKRRIARLLHLSSNTVMCYWRSYSKGGGQSLTQSRLPDLNESHRRGRPEGRVRRPSLPAIGSRDQPDVMEDGRPPGRPDGAGR